MSPGSGTEAIFSDAFFDVPCLFRAVLAPIWSLTSELWALGFAEGLRSTTGRKTPHRAGRGRAEGRPHRLVRCRSSSALRCLPLSEGPSAALTTAL